METLNSVIQVLQLNETFFIYLIVFFVFMLSVAHFLLKPYYEKFEAREKQTKGRVLLSTQLQKEEEHLNQEYEKKLVAFHQKFQKELNEKKNQILKTHQVQMDQTRKEAQDKINTALESFQKELAKAEEELGREAPQLAKQLKLKLIQ
ncbi:MAG: ATP synthase F0 subunit B [Bdellovibrionales bacterium]|nr:ATP synthase F0 subunit B [Bdellovibrionales bacterium]